MKRFYAVLLMISLLLPSGAFATDLTETDSQDLMTQQNKELTEYLIANVSLGADMDAIDAVIQAFYTDHPQYVNAFPEKHEENPQKLNTETIYIKEAADGSQGSDATITFYDDNSFIIAQSSHSTLDDQALEKVLNKKGLTIDSLDEMFTDEKVVDSDETLINKNISPTSTDNWKSASKNNIHQRYDNGVFKWRTFLNATFTFNGTQCNPIDWQHNYRLGTNVDGVGQGWIDYFHTGYNFATVKRTQSFREFPGGYYVGDDDLRVSCNQNGQFFLN